MKLLALFILIPLIELALLIRIGEYIGVVWTILLVGSTGAVGISLARQQGLAVVTKLKRNLSQGQLPHDSLLDGVLVLVGAATLLTPGLLTDLLGFSLIIPNIREIIKKAVKKQLKKSINISTYSQNWNSGQENKNQGQEEIVKEGVVEEEDIEEEIIDIEDYEEVD